MARALCGAAERAGAVVRQGQQVVGIVELNHGVAVTTEDGQVLTADRVVICVGPHSQAVAAMCGYGLPVTRVPGLVVTTRPVPAGTLSNVVLLPHINIRPTSQNQLLAHSYTTEARLPNQIDDADTQRWTDQVVHEAARVLPRFGQAGAARARIGVRPVPADGLPIAGWLDPEQRCYALVSHSGINFAPLLARDAAREILDGHAKESLAPFRPDRESLRNPASVAVDESMREMTRILVARLIAACQIGRLGSSTPMIRRP